MDAHRPPSPEEDGETDSATPPGGEERPFFPDLDTISHALENGGVGIWSWDIGSNRVTWSTNVEKILGRAPGSFDGTFASFESDIHPEDRPAVVADLQAVLQTGTARRLQYRVAQQAGADERWIESLATVAFENGKAVRMLGLCREVTDRARMHRELHTRANQQEAVVKFGERALTESDLTKLFEDAVRVISGVLDVELVKILELVPGDAELVLRAGTGWKPGLLGTAHVSTARDSQAGFTLASGGPVIVDNLATETRFVPPTAAAGTRGGQRHQYADRRPRWSRLRRTDGPRHQAPPLQRIRRFVPRGRRQCDRRRDPAPAIGSAPRTDDPRIAASLGQSVCAASGAVLADRQELQEPRRAGAEIRGARAGAGECPSADHRGRLEIGFAHGDP